MSTKRMEKTVIEGGRIGRSKYERRNSNKEQRATERDYLSKITKDPDSFDEDFLDERAHHYKEFNDKLSPMYRWLAKQVGRRWDEVRSEVFQKFDTRTVAGRHITFDHLLSQVNDTRSGWDSRGRVAANHVSYGHRFNEYYVDEKGILCQNKNVDYTWRIHKPEVFAAISKWLNGRMIGEKGGRLYWFTTLEGFWKCSWEKAIEKTIYGTREGRLSLKYFCTLNSPYLQEIKGYFGPITINRTGSHWEWIENPANFKQRGELLPSDAEYFRSLPKDLQEEILAFGAARF